MTGVGNVQKQTTTLNWKCPVHIFETDSVRAFKERNKLGRFQEVDPEEKKRQEEEKQRKEQENKERAEKMKIGDR